jgi:transcriptional regulator with XRE-family HTH domain
MSKKKAVREIRRTLGMNQLIFWRRIGVTQSGGSRYETGRSMPKPVKTLLQLAYGTDAEARAAFNKLREYRAKQPGAAA